MNVILSPETAKLLEEQMKRGGYASADDALRLALDVETINSEAGWFPAGSRPQDYEYSVGTTEGLTRKLGFRIKAKPGARSGGNDFGTLMRLASAEGWQGKRVQLSARMKSEDAGKLQLWLRVDSANRNQPVLAFYNMVDRAVRGTSGWKRRSSSADPAGRTSPTGARGPPNDNRSALHGTGTRRMLCCLSRYNRSIANCHGHDSSRAG